MQTMITVDTLTYTYPKATSPAVKGISFKVEDGEILGFLGPSGAGKSTTQKVLIGLLKGYQGQVQVMGRELSMWGRDYYEHIGVSFEFPNHYLRLTALENLNYFRSLYHGETNDPKSLLEQVGLGDSGDALVSTFSKGMKNRLNFARSLLNKPKLLFCDEPTSGLDPVNARVIKDVILEQQRQGTTVFVTTHNMGIADELCDRVAFILDGEIKLIDTPKSLKMKHGERTVRVEYQNGNSALSYTEFAMDGLGHNQAFLELLQKQPIETIHSAETTLDNIFIQVTGRSLE
jgi:fluoroquinolone transport system ATP-binding protein